MGSFGAGLASVGGAVANAEELQRKQKLEDIKLALEQGQLATTQKYADIAGIREKREQAQFEEQLRLARQPKFIGFRSVGGRLYYGLQNPDGTVATHEVTGVDAEKDAQALEQAIEGLPQEAQGAARSTIVPYLAIGDYQGARGALKPIQQKYAESLLPGQTEVDTTTETHELDTPQGRKLVQVPKTTTKQKIPAKGGVAAPGKVAGGVAGLATAAPGKAVKPPAAKSPAQIAKEMGLPSGSKVIGVKPPSRTDVTKLILPLSDADKRYKVMMDAVANPGWQNDVALLFNHIGMTLSAQRGARITSAEIERAITARDIAGDLLALWQKAGVSPRNKGFLVPEQRQQMLELGRLNRQFIWQQGWENSKVEAMANYLPKTLPGLPPVPGVHYLGEDVQLKGGGKARVTQIHPDGSYEVKPY